MNNGDLVRLAGSLFSTWAHQDEVGLVVSNDHFYEGLLVLFADGEVINFNGYKDHLEVINEGRRFNTTHR